MAASASCRELGRRSKVELADRHAVVEGFAEFAGQDVLHEAGRIAPARAGRAPTAARMRARSSARAPGSAISVTGSPVSLTTVKMVRLRMNSVMSCSRSAG